LRALAYLPASHTSHAVAPAGRDPGSHALQLARPVSRATVRSGQSRHSAARSPAYLPMGQATHALWFTLAAEPALHGWQTDARWPEATRPGSQMAQAVALSAA
jgi:hypothetical protein